MAEYFKGIMEIKKRKSEEICDPQTEIQKYHFVFGKLK